MSFRPAAIAALASSFMMGGCVVGPDFKSPPPPAVTGYTAKPVETTASTPGVPGGQGQHFVSGADIPADWWRLFHSKPLNDLIERALANNADLAAAKAAILVAHETSRSQHGAYYPEIDATPSISREKDPGETLAPVPANNALAYSLITPQLSISYTPDVFGLNKRTVESLAAQEQATRYEMIAVGITLTANVAEAAIQEASLEDQIDATNALIEINRRMLEILKYQKSKGVAAGPDLAAQEAQLSQVEASLPPLLKQRDQDKNSLAALAGSYPGQAPADKFTLASLTLPADLPLSLPSSLVAQRPDVLQAQANLHSASAEVGVATAARLPNITLSANAGSNALAIGQLFGPGTGFWNLGAALLGPILDGGRLLHQQRAARAAYTQSAAEYRGTVLTAFQNVADTLAALQHDADTLKSTAAAADAAERSLDLARLQYGHGYAPYLSVLNGEQAYQQSRLDLIQAEADRFTDTVALFQALGGGWWHNLQLTSAANGR